MNTLHNFSVEILNDRGEKSLETVLRENRHISDESFFTAKISDFHDPFLLPDMDQAVKRILHAREKKERIVVFGDYDVDGVSGTALLLRYLLEIGCEASYRLPHRVHDGYGLKDYFFDELAEKGVKLVVTVDCGTRDILPIHHAKTLGIDVVVTDHHAVPSEIPEDVIAIVNPKRPESAYPFRDLAGAGVALKLVHAIASQISPETLEKTLAEYADFASLGTVSDCMPIIDENRTIVTLGLKQMGNSRSHGLRNFLTGKEKKLHDSDIIGFQIGPRINAAGRMDTPYTALQWLLASDSRSDEFFAELEHLNLSRREITEKYFQDALEAIDPDEPILFYDSENLEHGVIGLVAGKLTEMYGKPAIVVKNGDDHPLVNRKGYDTLSSENGENTSHVPLSVGSCRSPEWCSIIEILDECRDLFLRYGGHRQAAGFTIETEKIPLLRTRLREVFCRCHDEKNLPHRTRKVECILDMKRDFTHENIEIIDRFRPFGIGNEKPLFLLQDQTITSVETFGKEGQHLRIRLLENPEIQCIAWGWGKGGRNECDVHFAKGDIISLIIELEESEWNGKKNINGIIRDCIL